MFLSIAFVCDKIQDTPPPRFYLEEMQVEGFMFSVTQEQEMFGVWPSRPGQPYS